MRRRAFKQSRDREGAGQQRPGLLSAAEGKAYVFRTAGEVALPETV